MFAETGKRGEQGREMEVICRLFIEGGSKKGCLVGSPGARCSETDSVIFVSTMSHTSGVFVDRNYWGPSTDRWVYFIWRPFIC